MASSGNFCTYSPRNVQGPAGPGTYSATKGNLGGTTTSGSTSWVGTTFGLPSGKWYWEARSTGATSGWPRVGFYSMGAGGDSISSITTETSNNLSSLRLVHNSGCGVEPFGSTSVTEITGSISSGDIVQIAIDVDAGKIWYGVNNTYLASGNPTTGANAIDDYTAATYNPVMPCVGTYSSQALPDLNFGQDSTFGGVLSAGGNADGNGFGDFKYAPPTGFLALCSGNLPISDDIDPAQTDSNYGATQFGTVSYTGTGSSNAITGLGFQPDLVWIKRADNTAGWKVTDSTRGVTKVLQPVGNNAEETDSNGLTSFDSDGFTVGSDSSYNASSSKILAYGWRANGGTTSSNTDGSITTTIQTSDSGGFSIIKYTGTGSNATLGHGMSKAPDFMIFKCTTTTDNWIVYHREFGAGNRAQLNNAGIGWGSSSTSFQSTDPDNSVITIGTSSGTNSSSGTMICYAWASIEGYSKFSSYSGTGSTDGAFCFTSFLPKMTWFKRNGSGDWIVNTYDENSVDTSYINPAHNPLNNRMLISSTVRATGKPVDFLSNGYKIRHIDSDSNLSGVKYPVICWGSVPFKYNNTF